MSYILDALRKADAQRARDSSRGIHAQPLAGSGAADPSRRALAGWFWIAAGAGVATLLAAGWFLFQDKAPERQVPAAARVATASPAAAPVPAPATTSTVFAPQPATAVEPPPPARVIPPRDPTNQSQPTMRGGPQPVVGTTRMAQAGDRAPATLTPPGPVPAPTSGPVQGPPPGAPSRSMPLPQASQPVPAQNPRQSAIPQQTAPEVVQQQSPPPPAPPQPSTTPAAPVVGLPGDAPKLAISGGVYSANPAQRMLIVNGQVFNEGSEIGPGVTLDEIRSKTAVLRFKGARYTVGF